MKEKTILLIRLDAMKYAFKNAGASFLLFVFPLTLFAAFVEAFATPLFIKAFLN